MKSLVLKDIFNIWHNIKTLGFVLALLLITFIPQGNLESYIIFVCVLCSTMIITTFNFDEHSSWVKYAMIMPLSKKDYVISKFVTLLIFGAAGMTASILFGIIGSLIFNNFAGFGPVAATSLFSTAFTGLMIAIAVGSTSILLLFRFGAARARIMSIIAIAFPFSIIYVVYELMETYGISLREGSLAVVLRLAPLAVVLWSYSMYRISYRIFSKKELLH